MIVPSGQKRPTKSTAPAEPPGAVGEDPGVVVADVDDDVEAEPAVRRDRLVEAGVESRDERREIRPLGGAARPEADARPVKVKRAAVRRSTPRLTQGPSKLC